MLVRSLPSRSLLVAGLAAVPASWGVSQESTPARVAGAHVEDIFIARSWRESQSQPTEFCVPARTGFADVYNEERYTFRSTETRVSDGLVVNTNVRTIGSVRGCYGRTADSSVFNFHAEGMLSGVSFVGQGECRLVKLDFPEPGVTVARCFLELRDLSAPYVGGHLTANTVNTRQRIGGDSDPPGYTQPSIATIRLWKRR